MMNKLFLAGIFFWFGCQALGAQEQSRRDKVEALRKTYITRHVELTETEAREFWPLYDSFVEEKRHLKKEQRRISRSFNEEMSDNELNDLYAAELKTMQKERDLEIESARKISKLIGTRKYMRLRRAEENFRREMLKNIRENRQGK